MGDALRGDVLFEPWGWKGTRVGLGCLKDGTRLNPPPKVLRADALADPKAGAGAGRVVVCPRTSLRLSPAFVLVRCGAGRRSPGALAGSVAFGVGSAPKVGEVWVMEVFDADKRSCFVARQTLASSAARSWRGAVEEAHWRGLTETPIPALAAPILSSRVSGTSRSRRTATALSRSWTTIEAWFGCGGSARTPTTTA